jgi:DNA-binding response OmpR family regulator
MVEQIPDSLEPTAPRLVLVVDDESRMRRFIRMNMELEGYQIIEAENGLVALEQIRQHTPDLVIMDVMMPEMDGFETLKLLREISTVPVILLTVKSDEDDKIQGLTLGADDYITKPFSPRELVTRVTAVLRRAQWPAPPPRTILRIDDRLSVDFNRHQVSSTTSASICAPPNTGC